MTVFIRIITALFLMLVFAAIGLVLFVDPNRYKEMIAQQASHHLQRPVTINGEIDWRFWPRLGFDLQQVHIGQKDSKDTLADIGQINVYVHFAPLFNQQIDVDQLEIKNAKVYVSPKINLDIRDLTATLYFDVPKKLYEAHKGHMKMSINGIEGLDSGQVIAFDFDTLTADMNTNQIKINQVLLDTVKVSGLTLSHASAHIEATQDTVTVSPMKAHFYSGTLDSQTTFNIAKAHWDIHAVLNQVDIAPFLKDLANNDKFSGNLNMNIDVTSQGLDSQSMLNSLNGNANFNIDKGVLHGADLGYWLSLGESLLQAKQITDLATAPLQAVITHSNMKSTAFDRLDGTFAIRNGIMHSDDLVMSSSAFYATGKGNIDLPKQHIDFALRIMQGPNDPAAIPLTVTGSLSNPTIGIDPAVIQTLLVKGVQVGIGTVDQAVPMIQQGIQSGKAPEQVITDTIKGLLSQ